MGKDPFAAYGDLAEYQKILDEVAAKLIACKDNLKTYWKGGDDLSAPDALGRSRSPRRPGTRPPTSSTRRTPTSSSCRRQTGALAWIDTFALPRKGEADDAAYKWINFVMQPEIVTMMSAKSGADRRRSRTVSR